jgi:Na+/proline symporter
MLWKVNKAAAWITMLAGYAANFLCTFAPDLLWWPEFIQGFKLNVYPTTAATIIFGIGLNLILPGKPGYLRQMKEAAK